MPHWNSYVTPKQSTIQASGATLLRVAGDSTPNELYQMNNYYIVTLSGFHLAQKVGECFSRLVTKD